MYCKRRKFDKNFLEALLKDFQNAHIKYKKIQQVKNGNVMQIHLIPS